MQKKQYWLTQICTKQQSIKTQTNKLKDNKLKGLNLSLKGCCQPVRWRITTFNIFTNWTDFYTSVHSGWCLNILDQWKQSPIYWKAFLHFAKYIRCACKCHWNKSTFSTFRFNRIKCVQRGTHVKRPFYFYILKRFWNV